MQWEAGTGRFGETVRLRYRAIDELGKAAGRQL
jgi:hypothetical protein